MKTQIDMRPVQGQLVKLLRHKQLNRGMTLCPFETRCLRRGDIHELVATDQADAQMGDRINRVGFLGFAEIEKGGVIGRGNLCFMGAQFVGAVLGFDDCHAPNHYNILIAAETLLTASELQLELDQAVVFREVNLISDTEEHIT